MIVNSHLYITTIYLIGFLDLFAVSLVLPVLSKHARSLGASPSVVGLLGSIYGGLQLFAAPAIGQWSDKKGCRLVLLWTLLLTSTGYFGLSVSSSILILALSRIPNGLFKHTQELARTYLAEATPKQEHSRVFGNLNAISSLGFVIGPTVGGHIAKLDGGFFICSFLCGSIFLLNYALVWLILKENDQNTSTTKKDQKSTKNKKETSLNPLHILQAFKRFEWSNLWDIFCIRFFMGFAVLVYRSNFSMWLDYKFEVDTTTVGYLSSFSAIIGTITSFLVGYIAVHYKDNNSKMLFHACTIQLVVITSLTIAPSVWFVALLTIPLSIANAIARVASTNLTIERGGGHETGTLLGLGASILSLARMAAPTIGGIAQEMHISGPTIVGSIFGVIGVSVMLMSTKFRESTFNYEHQSIRSKREKEKKIL